jgi:hypothetical protein
VKKILFFLISLIGAPSLYSQSFEGLTLENVTYVHTIQSIKLTVGDLGFGQPILILNGEQQLFLRFDDLETEAKYLKYTLIHCTYDWKLSNLNQIEYLEGYFEDDIKDYTYSFNTLQNYIHYELLFPNEYINITKSGNYILFVYEEEITNPVLTRRIMIVEPEQVGILGSVHAATNVNKMYSHQEVDFVVRAGRYNIRNPQQYLHATIMQNGRWDNAIIGLLYRYGNAGEFSFEYDNDENSMNGGSDFRTFDIRTLFSNGDRIVSIRYENREHHAYILEDRMRPFNAYESRPTLKGQNFYKTYDYNDKNREEYVQVHFALRPDYPVEGGNLYVFGELTDRQIKEEAKLHFNSEINYWETTLYLKQGYYNYEYVFVKNGTQMIDETYIEGSHWQTENEYSVLIYLREEGTSYDKLVGYKFLTMVK